jgi:hypothetical protein
MQPVGVCIALWIEREMACAASSSARRLDYQIAGLARAQRGFTSSGRLLSAWPSP